MHENTKYRADMDGLRGIAVLFVVLFHAGLSFRGGFIGVDVFFVISGYLITGLVLRDLEKGVFSLAYFWERRVRRILPAMSALILSVLALGHLLMLPEDLASLGRSALAQVLLAANIFFWHESGGYFAGPADEMPLLHMWSLAVEEQFYLFMPFLLLALSAWCRKRRLDLRSVCLRVFGLMFGLSLGISVWTTHSAPDWAYYWLPSRAWEFLLGSLLACAPEGGRLGQFLGAKRGRIAGLSFVTLLATALLYKSSTPFPGFAALPPCLATAALIWANDAGARGWTRTVLESRFILHLGRISYSLYLWHWPLLAFVHYLNPVVLDADSRACRMAVVLLSWALAWLSWRWVETPVRVRRDFWNRRILFAGAFAVTFATGITGWLFMDGRPGRIKPEVLAVAGVESAAKAWPDDRTAPQERRLPSFGSQAPGAPVHVLVWGDSHAKSIVPALEKWCVDQGRQGLIASYSATAPMLGFYRRSSNGLNEQGLPWGEAVLDIIREKRIPHTVLTALWSKCPGSRTAEFGTALVDTVRLLRATGTRVWVMLDVPTHDFAIGKALAFHSMHPALFRDPRRLASTLEEHHRLNSVIESLVPELEKEGAGVLDPSALLFSPDGAGIIEVDGQPLFKDGNHLTRAGALRIHTLFSPVFQP